MFEWSEFKLWDGILHNEKCGVRIGKKNLYKLTKI